MSPTTKRSARKPLASKACCTWKIWRLKHQSRVTHIVLRAQVDIFSLGVIMYELFLMCPMLEQVSKSGQAIEFEVYAKLVSMGQRQPLKTSWPESLKVLPCAAYRAIVALRILFQSTSPSNSATQKAKKQAPLRKQFAALRHSRNPRDC